MLGPSKISARPRFIKIHGKWQRCQIYIADQTLINSFEALEKSRRGEIKIHGEREGCPIYKADQPLIGNSLGPKRLHQSHPRHGVLYSDQVVANYLQHLSMQGCDSERSGSGSGGRGGGQWQRGPLFLLLLLILILLVVHRHGRGKRLGTSLVVKLYTSCFVSLEHVSMFDYAGGARA